MHKVTHVLGGYPIPGVVVVILAGAALLFWEYLRLADSSGLSRYLPRVRLLAVSFTVLSAVLIVSRFIFIERL